MPVTFRIFSSRGLVFVRYAGHCTSAESFTAIGDYLRHPDFRPGQKQLVDLAGVTSFDHDFVQLLAMQARKADIFGMGGTETLIVYHAPNNVARDMARMVLRSWEPFDHVAARVQETEADALALLGEPETSFADFFAQTDSV